MERNSNELIIWIRCVNKERHAKYAERGGARGLELRTSGLCKHLEHSHYWLIHACVYFQGMACVPSPSVPQPLYRSYKVHLGFSHVSRISLIQHERHSALSANDFFPVEFRHSTFIHSSQCNWNLQKVWLFQTRSHLPLAGQHIDQPQTHTILWAGVRCQTGIYLPKYCKLIVRPLTSCISNQTVTSDLENKLKQACTLKLQTQCKPTIIFHEWYQSRGVLD